MAAILEQAMRGNGIAFDPLLTAAPQQPTPNGEFRCGVCNKTYARGDLRDRHRRRCVKTIGQDRHSKRKSCETCAQKKLKCSMTRPACSRCLKVGVECKYPKSAFAVQATARDFASTISLTPSPVPSGTIQPSLLQDLHYTALPQLDTSNSAVWGPLNLESPGPMASALVESSFQNASLLDPVSWNEEFSTSSQSLSQDKETVASISRKQSKFSRNSSSSPLENRTQPDGFNLFDTIQPYPNSPYLSFNQNTSNQAIFARDFYPQTGPFSTYDSDELYHQTLAVLAGYPSLILQPDHCSPFVHHRMYRCSMGRMAKPMRMAIACVSGYVGGFGWNHWSVGNLVKREREQLVRDFRSFLDTPENCLAAVHAVLIYHILGLFGDTITPAGITQRKPEGKEDMNYQGFKVDQQAELYSSFALKMTRCLYIHYNTCISTPHDEELNFERWKFAESLRRNIFFANIINVLAARRGRLNGAWFESLDDEIVLSLPLPAPECMWRACSLREWLEAREVALGTRAGFGLEGMETRRLTQTLRELLAEEEVGRLDVSTMLPLTRVILASTKIARTELTV